MFEDNINSKKTSNLSDVFENFKKMSDISKSINNPFFTERKIDLEYEITQLKRELREKTSKLKEEELEKQELKAEKRKVHDLLEELDAKQKINHILPRICEEAGEKLFTDEGFKQRFNNKHAYDTVVLSIDIRRSTELMLKARKPELFSKFITELSEKLSKIIIDNYGIFDKFTGDGILAFFPKFYSGEKAIVRALKASQECHQIFKEHYWNSRACFNVFVKDVGLGIGVDYGNVTLVNTNNELTVVGIPVVYACRMSGAKAGDTLLNQPAKEELIRQYQHNLKIVESEINIKNEGLTLAYKVEFVSEINIQDDFEWKQYNKNEEKNTEQNIKNQRKINK